MMEPYSGLDRGAAVQRCVFRQAEHWGFPAVGRAVKP
jgi:hypothetical protein